MIKKNIKRIDCVGNANNYVLMIARALRALGYNAHLHLTMGSARDNPETLYPEYEKGYPDWIHDWRIDKKNHVSFAYNISHRRRLAFALRYADALILNFDNIALGALLDKPAVCILTGTDIYNFANPDDLRQKHNFGNAWRDRLRVTHMLMQRAAIRNACGFVLSPQGVVPRADAILRDIGAQENRRISFFISDTDALCYSQQPMREEMRVLYSARLSWDIGKGDVIETGDKGTDIFLRAFARFIHEGGRARLTLFKIGARLIETQALAGALGIEPWIDWREHMPQAEFHKLMRDADLVVDQTGKAHIAMSAVAAMSLGRPVIAASSDSALWNIGEPFPVCHATTEEEICHWLRRLAKDLPLRETIGKKSSEFAQKYFSIKQAAKKILLALHGNEQNYGENWLWRQYENAVWQEFNQAIKQNGR